MQRLCQVSLGILVLVCLGCSGAVDRSGWRLQAVPIQTRWAKDVSPTNPWPEYPRPQMVRAQWRNLNGLWDYAITAKDAPKPSNFEGQILVPYPIESALSGVQQALLPTKRLWYRRTFARPAGKKDERVLLHFGAVDWQATVYVNGEEVGQHEGGYQAFTFDITPALKAGRNELVVAVWDPTNESTGANPAGKQVLQPGGIMYTAISGIWQTVWLETVPAVSIAGLTLTPDVDAGVLRVRVQTSDSAGGQSPYTVQAIAAVDTGIVGTVSGQPEAVLELAVPQAHSWSPADPFLYDLSIRLLRQGQVVDSVGSYFGMREIEIKKDSAGVERIFLNDQYTYHLGVLDQGYWPDGLYAAPTDAALRFDIEAIKALGFNTIRKHIKVEPARWYYHADRLGMLVWQDMPQPKGSDRARAAFEREAAANIAQLYNHPSIVVWVLFNEGWGAYNQERLTTWLKQRDPTRLVNGHSGGYINTPPPGGAEHKWVASDMTDIHAYPNPDIPPAMPGKARVLGEFGGVGVSIPKHQWNEVGSWGYVTTSPHKLIETYDSMVTRLKQLEAAGLSGSIYTEPFDVETEENGLLTYDRAVLKLPLDTLRAMNARLVPPTDGGRAVGLAVQTADSVYPAATYATLLEQYRLDRQDPFFVRALARRARAEGDTATGAKLSAEYIARLRNVHTPAHIHFVREFTQRSTDPGFALFSRQGAEVDQVMGEPGYAENVVDGIIAREEIDPTVFPENNQPSAVAPDWAALTARITTKYDARYADRIVLRARARWSWGKREFATHFIAFAKKYGEERSGLGLNEAAWGIFLHSQDEEALTMAAAWMARWLEKEGDLEQSHSEEIDTYANLLYKLGRVNDAITWQEKALTLLTPAAYNYTELSDTLEKMKRGEPTWPTP